MESDRLKILLPSPEKRLFKYLELENGIKVALISDEKADVAAAALSVRVGGMQDGMVEGIAHFCEHLLFLGSEAYPGEDQYMKFLHQHGGMANAFTGDENTCYFFTVDPPHLRGALEIFCEFFRGPTFKEDAIERELQAIESEHQKILLADERRINSLLRIHGPDAHPFNHFSCGNLKTLRDIPKTLGISIFDEVKKFHWTFYSSNIMSLAIVGKESLDELEQHARDLFTPILNKEVPLESPMEIYSKFGTPLHPKLIGNLVRMVPVRDFRCIMFVFPIPPQRHHWRSKPSRELGHLIGHEGEGSILAALKASGLVLELVAGLSWDDGGATMFSVSVTLTPLGSTSRGVEIIGQHLFAFISKLIASPPESWVFEEIRDLANQEFKFKTTAQPWLQVVEIVHSLHLYPPEYMAAGDTVLLERDEAEMMTILNSLKTDTCAIIHIDKDHEEFCDQTDKYFETKFCIGEIPKEWLEAWGDTTVYSKMPLHLPHRNAFVPTDIEVYAYETPPPPIPRSFEFKDIAPGTTLLYFREDVEYELPKAIAMLKISSPFMSSGIRAFTLSQIHIASVKEALNKFTYDAEVAGFRFSVVPSLHSSHAGGDVMSIEVQVRGWRDKFARLLREICGLLGNALISKREFEIAHEILKRNYSIAAFTNTSYQQAMEHHKALVQVPYFRAVDLYNELQTITYEHVAKEATGSHIFGDAFVEGLIQGNVKEEDVENWMSHVVKGLGLSDLPKDPNFNSGCRTFAEGSRIRLIKEGTNPDDTNSGVTLFVESGCSISVEDGAMLNLVCNVFQQSFFDQLRTKMQLGYVVSMGVSRHLHSTGIQFLVQSTRTPDLVTSRIVDFILDVIGDPKGTSLEDLELHKTSLISKLRQKPKSLKEEAARHFDEICIRRFEFERREAQANFIQGISLEDFVDYIARRFMRFPWIVVEVRSAQPPTADIGRRATEGEGGDLEEEAAIPASRVEWEDSADLPPFEWSPMRACPIFD